MKNKKNTIVIIILVLVIFFSTSFVLNYLRQFKNKKIGNLIQKNNIVLPSTPDELNTSKEILSWIDTQTDERGFYIENRFCDVKNDCKLSSKNDSVVASILGARYKFAVANKDDSQINKIKGDLPKYKEILGTTKELMNSNYHCYFLVDIYKSDKFSSEEKEIVKNICKSELYNIPVNPFYYELYENGEPTPPSKIGTNTSAMSKIIKDDYEKNIKLFLEDKYVPVESKDSYEKYSRITTDLIARSEITNDAKYINSIIYTFGKSFETYSNNYPKLNVEDRLAFGIASLEMYRLNKDEMYKELALKVYEKEKNNYMLNMPAVLEYQLLSEIFSKVDENISFVNNRKTIYDFIIKNYYHKMMSSDGSNKSGVIFVSSSTKVVQSLKDNSLFIFLISQ